MELIQSELRVVPTPEAEESAKADLRLNEPQKLTAEQEAEKLKELLRASS